MTGTRDTTVPLAFVAVLTLILLALGASSLTILAPPFLIGFAAYLLLPYRKQVWAFRTLIILCLIFLLWSVQRFGAILIVLGFSLFLAYVLDPAVDWLESKRLSRPVAILVLLIPVVAILALAAVLLLPPLVGQLGDLVESIPNLANDVQEKIAPLLENPRIQPYYERYQDQVPKLLEYGQQLAKSAVGGVFNATQTLGSLLGGLVLIPIMSFYFLRDYDRVREKSEDLVPRRYHRFFSESREELDVLLGHWLRGAFIVSLIIGVVTGIGLSLLGIPYALVLAAMAAVLNFVPVLGFWISFIVAAIVGLVHGGWEGLLQVSALYFALSVVEGQLLSPKIIGEAVGLHPVAMLVALIIFADVFGLLGAFLAVPLAIIALILVKQLRNLYLQSDLYQDREEESHT
ncbi:MAG: AI-2E family transporter [Candidatus Eisenbacteria bacterium]|uniref:AI-2E family transporter n=1 Tax=Eiseniibacteriota bacterium TaxID=2212470 RepID=A0A7Y2H3Q6_UNCEI|nr:AI-2E family transporter [Candidatus Eisenbacteria bacterium]